VSDALLQSLLALRKACVQLKAEVPASVRARLDIMTTVLAKLIVDARDRPGMENALLGEYATLPGVPGESDAGLHAASEDPGTRLHRARSSLQQSLRNARALGPRGATGLELKEDRTGRRCVRPGLRGRHRRGNSQGRRSRGEQRIAERSLRPIRLSGLPGR
jgi:hypothetical protein